MSGLASITFNKGQGGLGRPLTGEDHISGMVFYNDNYPSGFDSSNEVKVVYSLEEAEALGITETSTNHKEEWYQIREFFRLNPKGILYVGIFPVPGGSYTFAEVTEVQDFAEGKIRQFAVVTQIAGVVTGDITTLQAIMAAMLAVYRPAIALMSFDISGVADLSTLGDLRALTAPNCSVVIGQDGGAKGAALATSLGYSVQCIGAALGAFSAIKVNENIGWPKKTQANSESELEIPAFGNDDLLKATAKAAQDSLHDKGYIFLRKFEGKEGVYFSGQPTAVVATSDYAYQNDNRVIDKAIRLVYSAMVEELNGPIEVDPTTGYLSEGSTRHYKSVGDTALRQMLRDSEVSGAQALVNPDQDVNTTGVVTITLELVPFGTARKITVNIGFTTQLS